MTTLDYRPQRLDLAGDPTNQVAPSQGNTQLYGVNEPYGKPSDPLSQRDLRETFGAVGTVFFAGLIENEEYVTDLQGDRAIQTYERMWRSDGQVAAVVNVWVLPLLQATYSVQAASDDAEDVAVAQETSDNLLHGMVGTTWHSVLRQLYTFRAVYGHAVFEKCWTIDEAGAIRLRKLAPRLAKTLYRWYPNADDELDRIMQRVWANDENGVTGKYEFPTIPAQKLLVSTRNRIGNNFLGISLLRPAYKHWYYKDQLYALDGIAAAKNAMGVPSYSEPDTPSTTRQKADRDAALQALAQYQANERASFVNPSGWKLEFLGVSGQVRNIMPSIEHHDLLIARSILAQFINVDSGGTLIAARDSSSFFLQALFSEAQEVADDLNPLLREMEEYNHADRDRYSTLQMQDLDQRDVESYLRGLAGLFTAGGLTNTTETENALRDNLDLPLLPDARGAGTGGVDQQSQGTQATTPEERTEADQTAGVNELRRLAARAFGQKRHDGLVTVPRADGSVLRLTRSGGRWEPYTRRPSVWAGVTLGRRDAEYLSDDGDWICLRRKAGGRHSVPDPNRASLDDFDSSDAALRGFTHVLWRLGAGGVSGQNCPQCRKMAAKGLMRLSELHIQPGSEDTYCGDACSCELEYRRARTVSVKGASNG